MHILSVEDVDQETLNSNTDIPAILTCLDLIPRKVLHMRMLEYILICLSNLNALICYSTSIISVLLALL